MYALALYRTPILCNADCTGQYVNLDPAADQFEYEPDVDIKDLISLEDVMEEMQLGPNGGLMACFEYVVFYSWL